MKGKGLVLINNELRRMSEGETLAVMQLVGGLTAFNTAVELGKVYREQNSKGFFYVELEYAVAGAVVIEDTENTVMLTHVLTALEAESVKEFLGANTFNSTVETGKLYSSPYPPGLGSVQWYPGNDDNPVPPLK